LFAEHSWYFRNALVRANYEDLSRGVHKTGKYFIRFLSNLLLCENNILKNRELHIDFKAQNLYVEKAVTKDTVNDNSDTVKGGVDDDKLGIKLGKNQTF
jgi:hypothetical protein